MESTYFSLVLILVGVIMGGLVVLSFLRGLTGSVLRRAVLPTPTPYYVGTGPAMERGSIDWLLGLGLFVGLLLLLNTGKSQVESWWSQQQRSKKPPSSVEIAATDSTARLPKGQISAIADSASGPASLQQKVVIIPDSIYVQIGAFTQKQGAEQLAQDWMQKGYSTLLLQQDGDPLYKLCIGPFSDAPSAKNFQRKFIDLKGFLVIYRAEP